MPTQNFHILLHNFPRRRPYADGSDRVIGSVLKYIMHYTHPFQTFRKYLEFYLYYIYIQNIGIRFSNWKCIVQYYKYILTLEITFLPLY